MCNSLETHKCGRKIRPSKYEKQSSETFNWWLRLFHAMECQYVIPLHKRKEVIEEIFPQKILDKILSLISVVDHNQYNNDADDDDSVNQQSPEYKLCSPDSERSCSEASKDVLVSSAPSLVSEPIPHDMTKIKSREVGPVNPYLNFFHRNTERAAIWRELPPLVIENMKLSQKAEAITELIAVDFIHWIKLLQGDTKSTLDVKQVMKMFEIGFNTHAAFSLQSIIKDLPAVTKSVAEKRNLIQYSTREKLHEKLQKDILDQKRPTMDISFSKALPIEMRYKPAKKGPDQRWIRSNVRENIQSMAVVWEGITHLRSTRSFCQWLMEHPELPNPKYLESLGMLTPEHYNQPHYSIDTIESSTNEKHRISATLTDL